MKKVIRVKHGKKVHNNSALDCIDNIFFGIHCNIFFQQTFQSSKTVCTKKLGEMLVV